MIDAIAAAAASTAETQAIPAWMNQSPSAQDLATFDTNINAPQSIEAIHTPDMTIQSSYDYSTGYYNYDSSPLVNPIESTKPSMSDNHIGSQILKHFSSIDAKYQSLFNNDQSMSTISGVGNDGYKIGTSTSYEVTDVESLINNFQASVALQTEISVWSAQVNLLTSGISKSTQGIQTLFKSSG